MGWDYTDFSDFYPCTGTAGLIGENGNNFTEVGVVGEVTGKFDTARGTCDGNLAAGRGFQRSTSGGGVWDTRVSAGPFQRGSLVGWFKLAGNTGDQEFAAQARSGAANNTKQWMLRAVWQGAGDTAADDIATLFIWDHVANVFRVGAAVRGSSGPFPLGVWCMIGFSVDIPALEARLALGVPGESFYYNKRSITSGWNAFQATALDIISMGIGSGNSTEGIDGDIDHITWTKGRAYKLQDFLNHWNGGSGLPRANFFQGNPGAEHILLNRHLKARGVHASS